jgi:hypothetical protein
MRKILKKYILTGVIFSAFLCLFFFLSRKYAYALGLEIDYPEVSGLKPALGIAFDKYAEYLFNAGMMLGYLGVFIGFAWAGVLYFLSPLKSEFMSEAKERAMGAISGLLILTLTYLVITTINPQLSVFKLNKPPEIPAITAPLKEAGVYFYKDSACSGDGQLNTSSSTDLGDLKNQVRGVDLVTNLDDESFYVTVFYDNPGFWGRCQCINPNEGCTKIDPFADSVSIYSFEPNPKGDGVYFYRNSCFNMADNPLAGAALADYCNSNSGGYYKVTNEEIKIGGNGQQNDDNLMFSENLNNLHFTGLKGGSCTVPEDQQDCIKYDDKGSCLQRSCPSLGGENISSILVSGTYSIILSYAGPGESCEDAENAYCQNFPLESDKSKIGPQQIKWEHIRNINGKIPNCIAIIPIKNY